VAAPTTHGTAMIAAIAAAQRESRWLSSLALTRGTIQWGYAFPRTRECGTLARCPSTWAKRYTPLRVLPALATSRQSTQR
jgi:hypothetical protein